MQQYYDKATIAKALELNELDLKLCEELHASSKMRLKLALEFGSKAEIREARAEERVDRRHRDECARRSAFYRRVLDPEVRDLDRRPVRRLEIETAHLPSGDELAERGLR